MSVVTPTWNRANFALIDQGDARQGTVSVFFDYDLGNWTFGFRLEHDECWFDFVIQGGPFQISTIYWRVPMVANETAADAPSQHGGSRERHR